MTSTCTLCGKDFPGSPYRCAAGAACCEDCYAAEARRRHATCCWQADLISQAQGKTRQRRGKFSRNGSHYPVERELGREETP